MTMVNYLSRGHEEDHVTHSKDLHNEGRDMKKMIENNGGGDIG